MRCGRPRRPCPATRLRPRPAGRPPVRCRLGLEDQRLGTPTTAAATCEPAGARVSPPPGGRVKTTGARAGWAGQKRDPEHVEERQPALVGGQVEPIPDGRDVSRVRPEQRRSGTAARRTSRPRSRAAERSGRYTPGQGHAVRRPGRGSSLAALEQVEGVDQVVERVRRPDEVGHGDVHPAVLQVRASTTTARTSIRGSQVARATSTRCFAKAMVVVLSGSKARSLRSCAERRPHHPLAWRGADDDPDRLPHVLLVLARPRRRRRGSIAGGKDQPTPRNACSSCAPVTISAADHHGRGTHDDRGTAPGLVAHPQGRAAADQHGRASGGERARWMRASGRRHRACVHVSDHGRGHTGDEHDRNTWAGDESRVGGRVSDSRGERHLRLLVDLHHGSGDVADTAGGEADGAASGQGHRGTGGCYRPGAGDGDGGSGDHDPCGAEHQACGVRTAG